MTEEYAQRLSTEGQNSANRYYESLNECDQKKLESRIPVLQIIRDAEMNGGIIRIWAVTQKEQTEENLTRQEK